MTKIKNPSYLVDQQHLALRIEKGIHWVYAPIHGTTKWRWWIISEEHFKWYKEQFPAIVVEEIIETSPDLYERRKVE